MPVVFCPFLSFQLFLCFFCMNSALFDRHMCASICCILVAESSAEQQSTNPNTNTTRPSVSESATTEPGKLVSQGSVTTYATCGGIFNTHLTANLPRNLPVRKCLKSVKIWQNYGYESVAPFLAHPVDQLLAPEISVRAGFKGGGKLGSCPGASTTNGPPQKS